MNTTDSITFLAHYPGPYGYQTGTDGVDATFDVKCLTTNSNIVSIYYWKQKIQSELVARVLTACLNKSLPNELQAVSHTAVFRNLYPGPYTLSRIHCEYRGPGYAILSKTDSPVTVFDQQNPSLVQIIAQQLAAALNSIR